VKGQKNGSESGFGDIRARLALRGKASGTPRKSDLGRRRQKNIRKSITQHIYVYNIEKNVSLIIG
jgi:hypothetical protein